MKGGILKKRIPTFFVILFMFGVIMPTISLIKRDSNFRGLAGTDTTPKNLNITNVNSSSFTISFTTNTKTKALAVFSYSNNLTQLILDDRDKGSGIQKNYYSHFITIPNLNEKGKYTFKLLINNKEYVDPEFIGQTAPKIRIPSSIGQNPIFGKILLPNGQPASEALVLAKFQNTQLLSSISDEGGVYSFSLDDIRTANLQNFGFLKNKDKVEIKIFLNDLSSTIKTTYANSSDLPIVTLGKNYTFYKNEKHISSQSSSFKQLITASSSESSNLQNNVEFNDSSINSQKLEPTDTQSRDVLALTDSHGDNTSNNVPSYISSAFNFDDSFLLAGFSLFLIFLGVSLLFAL